MADGAVNIRIGADNKDANRKLDETSRKMSDLDSEGGKKHGFLDGLKGKAGELAKAIGVAAAAGAASAATALATITTQATQAFSAYQQAVGGIETIYGTDGAGSAEEYAAKVGKSVEEVQGTYDDLKAAQDMMASNAANAYKTAGVSATQYMQQATMMGPALKKSLGGDSTEAARMADMAITDMSDNANKLGTDLETLQQAYSGFARGNYMMLDSLGLGYSGTKEGMEQLIADANEYEKAQGRAGDLTIDSYADQVQAIHDVQEQMGIMGTTADEAATTVEGSTRMMQAAWENWLMAIGSGEGVEEATSQLVEAVGIAASNVIPVIVRSLAGLSEALPGLIADIQQTLLPLAKDLGTAAAGTLAAAINGALAAIGLELPPISGVDILRSVQAVLDGIQEFAANFKQGFEDALGGSSVSEAVQGLVDAIGGLLASLQPVAEFVTGPLASALGSLAGGALLLATDAINAMADAIGWLSENMGTVAPIVAAVAAGIGGLLVVTQVVPAVMGLVTAIQSVFTALSMIKSFAGLGAVITTLAGGPIPLIVAAIAALVAGIVVLWTTNEGFRTAVTDAWNAIVATVSAVVGALVTFFTATLPEGILSFGAAIASLPGTIGGLLGAALGSVGAFVGQIASNAVSAGAQFLSGISSGFGQAVSFVAGIPSRMLGALGDLGSLLLNSGKSLIDGFVRGIKDAFGSAQRAVSDGLATLRSFFPFSPAKRGPFSGHGYTTFSGRALMRDFASSIEGAVPMAVSAAYDALSDVQGVFDGGFGVEPSVTLRQPQPLAAGIAGSSTTYQLVFNGATVNEGTAIDRRIESFITDLHRLGALNG